MSKDLPDALADCCDELRQLLLEQTRALDALIDDIKQDEKRVSDAEQQEILNTVVLMIQSLGVAIHSALRLTATVDMAIRDTFGIARSATELGVNIAYIAVGGVDLAHRAQQHALQKTYRDQVRAGEVGGVNFEVKASGPLAATDVPGLAEALDSFTDAKGREIRDWTSDNIDRRIDLVRSKHAHAALSLSGAVFAIYRHSSELLHGTYFSVLYFWTGSRRTRPISRESFAWTWLGDHFVTIFTALFFTANGVIDTMRDQFDLPEKNTTQKSLLTRANIATEHLGSLLDSDK